jgi:hypothetical protein
MLTGDGKPALARDTMFADVMTALNSAALRKHGEGMVR